MSSPIKDFHRQIPALLLSALSQKGKTIRHIEDKRGRTIPGDASQHGLSGDEPVWHSRADILERIGDAMGVGPKYRGARRTSNDFHNAVDQELSKLRKKGHLIDWNNPGRAGIFCLGPEHRAQKDAGAVHADMAKIPDGAAVQSRRTPAYGADDLGRLFLTILSRGRKDNTYKFALARALLEYCRDTSPGQDGACTIPYSYLAGRFLKYYWHQECKFRIKQDFKTKSEPKVITAIRKTFAKHAGRTFEDVDVALKAKATSMIQRDVFGNARSKTSLVVPRFQRVMEGGCAEERNVFYDYNDEMQVLTLKPEAFAFFKKNHALLHGVVLVEWAKFLERVNGSLPRLIAKIEQNEAKRQSLARFRAAYAPYMRHCFYCRSRLDPADVQADHFIPWSYIFEDEAWNMVLSCGSCNRKKSDSLPQEEYLYDLLRRNDRYRQRIGILSHSLKIIDTTLGWQREIQNHYEVCQEYGFVPIKMP